MKPRKILNRIQRIARLAITGAIRTTPTVLLALLVLLPFYRLKLMQERHFLYFILKATDN